MRKETRFLLCGMFAGLVLGVLATFAIQHRRGVHPMADATRVNHSGVSAKTAQDGLVTAMVPQERAGANGVITQSDESVAIQIIPSSSLKFSVPFVKAVRELKAAGEPLDVVVNVVVAEFTRQWRDQMKEVNRKLQSGEIDREEGQEFFSGREDAIGRAVTELLGQDSFVYWDRQRLLRKASATGYKLTEAESDDLYRVEKEHEDRKLELNAALNAGEIDRLDFEEQNKASEGRYQQLRAKLLTEDRRIHEQGETVNLLAQIKEQTRDLNLTPQQLAELVDVTRKSLQVQQEPETLPKDATDADKLRALQAATERDSAQQTAVEREWMRILGPGHYADFKRAQDYRYQEMKHYQKLWRLSDNDVNYLYQTFQKYDRAIEAHSAQAPPTPEGKDAGKETSGSQIDEFAKAQTQQLEAELLRFLGEERFLRFKAAGLIPQNE